MRFLTAGALLALTACGGDNRVTVDDVCDQIRADVAALVSADGMTERLNAISDDAALMAEDAGITGDDIRAECDADADRLVELQGDVLRDPTGGTS